MAHATGVVRPVEVATSIGLLVLAFSVVAVVAHVFGVVLPVRVRTHEDLSPLSLSWFKLLFQPLLLQSYFLLLGFKSVGSVLIFQLMLLNLGFTFSLLVGAIVDNLSLFIFK